MKIKGVVEFFYNFSMCVYYILKRLIGLLIFIRPIRRIRDEDGNLRGIVIMRPARYNGKLVVKSLCFVGNFK